MNGKARQTLKTIIILGLLAAMSIVVGRFLVFYITEDLRISLDKIPVILAGIWFGPVAGMAVGIVEDIIGSVVFSSLGWFPPLTVPPALIGLMAGLAWRYLPVKNRIVKTVLTILLSEALISLLVTTAILSWEYGTPYLVRMQTRLPVYACVVAAEFLSIPILNTSAIEQELKK